MRFDSKICHLSENKTVVQVTGWLNDKNIGSALAEGTTVEIAEDKAISRLNERVNFKSNIETNIYLEKQNKHKNQVKVELPISEKIDTDNMKQEPSDWSNELTAIDSEIQRLCWSRDDEMEFLKKTFGYKNRNKITKYNELVHYLGILKKIDNQNSHKTDHTSIENMMEETDIILKELSWDYKQGREYLQKEFNVSTRKELDETQLISFVAKLKSIRNQYLTN